MPSIDSPFSYCQACRAPQPEFRDSHELRCLACGFRYFHNVASAVGLLLEQAGRFLFLVRGHQPAKGKLGLPGGFVNPGETLEQALEREVLEEVGGQIDQLRFVASFPNRYSFAGITYATCDCYFQARLLTPAPEIRPTGNEVAAVCWLSRDQVDPEQLAFASLAALWQRIAATF